MSDAYKLQEPVITVVSTRLRRSVHRARQGFNRWNAALLILGVAFFFIYCALIFFLWLPKEREVGHLIYNWPDATANQAVIDAFIDSSRFSLPEPLNESLENIVHPRSMKALNGAIVPAGFLGMPILFGALGKILGHTGILFLGPFFSVIGVWCFYWLLRKVFDREIAFWSAVLAFVLPAYWYYSTLIMLPNIVFVSILIAGFALIVHSPGKDKFDIYRFALGINLIGIALTIRTVELPWIMLTLALLWVAHGSSRWFSHFIISTAAFAIAFVPILFFNKELYGEYVSVGYFTLGQTGNYISRLPREFNVGDLPTLFTIIKALILPFGWDANTFLKIIARYVVFANLAFASGAVLGVVTWFIKGRRTRSEKWFLGISLMISAWIALYYGNWHFGDQLVLKYNLIGSSYTRYFIPIFMLFLPWIGMLISVMLKSKIPKIISRAILALALAAFGYHSYQTVYAARYDGLLSVKRDTESYYQLYETVSRIVDPNAILIVDRTDKIFFPKYDVVVFLLDYTIFPRLKTMIGERPIYYISALPDRDIDYINRVKFKELKLKFVSPQILDWQYRLFQLVKI
ncbi:hypothetical protein A3B21_03040 [Candidatus Uhrbacteria bacterium RIFCSPLOWO2_01_FULL_47_24]|uniref:Uncharacterized protein n=1 Tax=Candidatus Uhrbacteria bacterium RIFCSPLOWO2_01_FULL_47_24 TaxID=1802401 RepID=A0A1F7URL5_9BACT|nr:MAG: hypothetical protein A2753_04965 [Candidatus Uhrbacteria bacterium RIFCSPHIGHO2_01_FULL_47_11]OGL67562.1 MAG: hypothetical protein A3D58_03640 [Candidatus Uhrbacteria bacterium RIFCSPHIGHO2_02_FULL_46_47]OGL75159.1 MAG: hypothetical protein A3F52_02655 [Candidatus Uhrbacteria bacterium RIFCSPHIGHO2_12_FULL_47_11]OGL80916.1 MAG: hypothetical protein A3B21_03040 [Candidatus Uhrbacteria bacterium RIFCSPLOWO2_01_FULL_47_24]OGL84251.1 MAG: hypothetical protein A3J03_03040 [Candidatus Uhrbact